ncbi:MAG TPA: glycosyltransferase family 39 protein, partial [Anaerolineae bacterium]|nr:glycosyltransferase family 39 protein [Anaerolineae bacterium]
MKGIPDMDVEIPPSRDGLFHLSSTRVSWAATLCLVVAAAAQQSLDQRTSKSVALLMYGAAAIAFGALLRHTAIESRTSQASAAGRTHPSPAVLGVTLGLSLLGCLDFGDNEFRPLGLVFWVGGLILTLLYLWMLSPVGARDQRPKRWWHRNTLSIPVHWFVLAGILCVGAWFRFRLLSEIPADLGPDLIHNYWNTADILQGKCPIMFPERESLIFYCTALCAQVVGLSQWTLHLTSALVGTATIVALYALGSEAFSRQVGLMAAFLMAVNRWHILLSRSAYRAVLTPLFTILVLYS